MLKFDLHVHSEYSRDSKTPIEDILKSALEHGLNGIAICDHDNPEGGRAAFETVRNNPEKFGNLTVIPGVEISTSEGHLLILNPPEENIPPGLTPEETIRRARIAEKKSFTGYEPFIIIPHPYRKSAHGIGRIEGLDVDAVESFNSKNAIGNSNKKAKNEADRLNLPVTGGSDAHSADFVGICFTKINIPENENNAEAVLKAIKERKSDTGGKTTPLGTVFKGMMKNCVRRIKKAIKGDYKEWR